MLANHKKDSKFLLEVFTFFESSLEDVFPLSYFTMSNLTERQGLLSFVMKGLLESLRESWVTCQLWNSPMPADEIIRSMSGPRPKSNIHIPDGFMEKFKSLPDLPMELIMKMLDYKDIRTLQLVSSRFQRYLRGKNTRNKYSMHNVLKGKMRLHGTETVSVFRKDGTVLRINHDQLTKCLQVTRINELMIAHEGKLTAASFHIPQLTCSSMNLRIIEPLDEEGERELLQVFNQITENECIRRLTLIARREGDPTVLRNQIVAITNRNPNLDQARTIISVIPP